MPWITETSTGNAHSSSSVNVNSLVVAQATWKSTSKQSGVAADAWAGSRRTTPSSVAAAASRMAPRDAVARVSMGTSR